MRKLTCTTCSGQGYSRFRGTCHDCKGKGCFWVDTPLKVVTIPNRGAYLLALQGQNLLHQQH